MADADDVILHLIPCIPASNFTYDSGDDGEVLRDSVDSESRVSNASSQSSGSFTLRFSEGPRTSLGIVCGCGPGVDLQLNGYGHTVSKRHLAFTFDDNYKPIARDLGSAIGTRVIYDNEQRARRADFDWPLLGPSITKGKPPILSFAENLEFEVVVPPRDLTSPDYINRVRRFWLGTANHDQLLQSLGLESGERTRRATDQPSPQRGHRSGPVHFEKEIGRGGFGRVVYKCNVRSGKEYVEKTPLKEHMESKEYDVSVWKREAEIMKGLEHPHIVKLLNATFTAKPRLKLEFIPEGTLNKHANLSAFERTQVLVQLSSALKYLHNLKIGHRDIKPQNILVQRRGKDGIFVKFADFGLSKVGRSLRTCCGTPLWTAPEVGMRSGNNDGYSHLVDVWSLGMVVASLEYGLPHYSAQPSWANIVREYFIEKLNGEENKLLRLILDHMLVVDPDLRSSVNEYYDKANQLLSDMAATQDSDDYGGLPTSEPEGTGYKAHRSAVDCDKGLRNRAWNRGIKVHIYNNFLKVLRSL